MKTLLYGVCVFLLFNIVLGQGAFDGVEKAKIHPDHPGRCWIEETKMSYSPGEKFIPKSGCREATCTDQEGDLILFYRGCGRRYPFCKLVTKNPESEYPGCCPEIVC